MTFHSSEKACCTVFHILSFHFALKIDQYKLNMILNEPTIDMDYYLCLLITALLRCESMPPGKPEGGS